MEQPAVKNRRGKANGGMDSGTLQASEMDCARGGGILGYEGGGSAIDG